MAMPSLELHLYRCLLWSAARVAYKASGLDLFPLVAAHFATEDINKFDTDGAIICCDMAITNRHLPENCKTALNDQCNVYNGYA